MKLLFPEKTKPYRYYDLYVKYIRESAIAAGLDVEIGPETTVNSGRFLAELDGTEIMFDYSDHPDTVDGENGHPFVFKLQTVEWHPPNIHPFPPVSFYDWAEFNRLKAEISYTANSDIVSCRQLPQENAIERRNKVQALLRDRYCDNAKLSQISQQAFWREIGDCLVHVCVPGCRNDILDRGMGQCLAFGACVIAPYISTRLPFDQTLIGGRHYVQCRTDYADLIDMIEWCRDHRGECVGIGNNGKRIFAECCEPAAAWRWVAQCVNK